MIRTIEKDLSLIPDDLEVAPVSDEPKHTGGLFIKELMQTSKVDLT